MSIDRSLKSGGSLKKHRNVLSRTERIEKLAAKGKFDMEHGTPLGLPKVGNRKVAMARASKKKKDEEAAEGAAPAAAS